MAEIDNENKFDSVYNQLSEISPPRGDVVSQDDELEESYVGTLAQRMKMSPKMTDFALVDKRLNPVLEPPWLNDLMVSEIFPEELVPLNSIITAQLLKNDHKMSVPEAIVRAKVATSIGFSREGRMDIVHIYGKTREEIESEKSKGI